MAEIPTAIMIGWDPWIKKMFNYLIGVKGKGGLKDTHCIAQSGAICWSIIKYLLFISIYLGIKINQQLNQKIPSH